MSDSKLSPYIKIGYKTSLTKGDDIDDFETITIKDKSGSNILLYREKSKKKSFDETTDFSKSWDVFNSHLN